MGISRVGAKKNLQPAILEATLTLTPIFGTAAYGRKQTFRLSLNACFLTAALEKKADIRLFDVA